MKKSIPFFAYLFFCLFVLNLMALTVSLFSSTFSQLFSLLSQDGRIFDVFLYFSYFLGFVICFYSLLKATWNQDENFWIILMILGISLIFVFLFVFGLFGHQERVSLLDLIVNQKQAFDLKDVFFQHFNEFVIFGFFYLGFVFAPLFCWIWKISPNERHPVGLFLKRLRPSLNIVIYVLVGCSLQSYFHKGHWIFYLDLIALIIALVMLVLVLREKKHRLDFFEICNLCFLVVGIVVFALSSKLVHEASFNARYDFFVFAFVAWCAEWMIEGSKRT